MYLAWFLLNLQSHRLLSWRLHFWWAPFLIIVWDMNFSHGPKWSPWVQILLSKGRLLTPQMNAPFLPETIPWNQLVVSWTPDLHGPMDSISNLIDGGYSGSGSFCQCANAFHSESSLISEVITGSKFCQSCVGQVGPKFRQILSKIPCNNILPFVSRRKQQGKLS